MKTAKYLDEKKVVERGVKALHRELGPVEARRFIAMASHKHEDSVSRHRKWQEGLDAEEFIGQIMADYKK
ncbi:MAG: hypothetical protein GF401_07525 [Chitinivibrionales bacterium]|nr:hypothetical protein [Chitinivibrionales bacterium]